MRPSASTPNWFVAFPFPEPVPLPEPPDRVRPFTPGDLHLTLAFLGVVSEETARRAFALACARCRMPATEVALGPIKLLGHPRNPTALAATLSAGGSAIEGAIANDRDEVLSAAGTPPDPRAPLAHLTLARIDRRASPVQRRNAVAWADALTLEAVRARVSALALYTWAEDRRKAQFRVVDSRPLADKAGP